MPEATYPGVALVTGAASGIGLETTRKLIAEGATALILVDRQEAALNALGDEVEAQGLAVMLCRQDVADEAAWEGIEHGIRHRWQGLIRWW